MLTATRTCVLRLLLLAGMLALTPVAARAQRQPTQPPADSLATIQGTITTQNGTIPLGGAVVGLSGPTGEPQTLFSDGDGGFKFDSVEPGQYKVTVTIQGFDSFNVTVRALPNQIATVPIDLQIAKVAESVDVVAAEPVVSTAGTLASSDSVESRELEQIAPGGGLQSALRLLVSVIQVPGGVAIKGGRPSQASVQLGPGLFVDPATGLTQGSLPDDAIEKVTVLPNPYAVEFGRFSSGVVVVQTRRAADQWRTRLNDLEPAFRVRRHRPLDIVGISSFSPRFETGGPLVKDRLFLQTSAQYRYRSNDIPSRPPDEIQTSHRFSSFTRMDSNVSSRHTLTAVVGTFPSVAKYSTLGTFTPPEASVDSHANVTTAGVTERSLWSSTLFSETTFEMNDYHNKGLPQGDLSMLLYPQTTLGNFFNHQSRNTATYQVIETLSGSNTGQHGLHLYKFGIDVLRNQFESTSRTTPVLIYRPDGTLARRLDYGPSGLLDNGSSDIALFAQDRWQPGSRWYLEFGGRLDRDGVFDRFNVTPRVGAAFLLNASGTAVIRSGYGLFYERTPSAAAVFDRYETPTETRYAANGITPVGPPMVFREVFGSDLRTPRSATWDVALDHRISPQWAFHMAVIDRHGSNELLVQRDVSPDPQLLLDSSGRSQYREAEFGVHYTRGTRADLNVSYVESRARADLNSFTSFFDVVRAPVLGPNAWAPARTDAPHRMLARGRLFPTERWLFVGVVDWRTGLPYSAVNESLDFVGPRNGQRFPAYFRLDAALEHRFKIGKYQPWIGVRADNVLNSWLPSDVQANVSSPQYGTFYNGEYRQFRIQIRFQR